AQQFRLLHGLWPACREALERAAPGGAGAGSPPGEGHAGLGADTLARVGGKAEQIYDGMTGEQWHQVAVSCLGVLAQLWPAQTIECAFGRPAGAEERPPAPAFL